MNSRYVVLVGMNYPPNRRAEPGDVVDDLPQEEIAWLLAEKYVEEVD